MITSKEIFTRREILGATTVGVALMTAAPVAHAFGSSKQTDPIPDKLKTSIHLEEKIQASPEQVYNTLLTAKQFVGLTGMPAEISSKAGGEFSMFGGLIVGRNIELVPNKRIVQAWRPSHWQAGVYSIVKFELTATDSTKLVLDHTGFPEGTFASLSEGWHLHYLEPLKKLFAK